MVHASEADIFRTNSLRRVLGQNNKVYEGQKTFFTRGGELKPQHSLAQSSSLTVKHKASTDLFHPGRAWATIGVHSGSSLFPPSLPQLSIPRHPKVCLCPSSQVEPMSVLLVVLLHARYMAKPFPTPLLHLFDDAIDACLLSDFSGGDSKP